MAAFPRILSSALSLGLLLAPQAEAARAVGAAAAAKPGLSIVPPMAMTAGVGASSQNIAAPPLSLSLPAALGGQSVTLRPSAVTAPGAAASVPAQAGHASALQSPAASSTPDSNPSVESRAQAVLKSPAADSAGKAAGRPEFFRAPAPEEISHRGLIPLAKALEGVSAETAASLSGTQGHALGLRLEAALTGGSLQGRQAVDAVPAGGDWKSPAAGGLLSASSGEPAKKVQTVSAEEKNAALEKLGSVSAPNIWLSRVGLAAFWGALLTASALPLYVAGKPALLIVGAVMAFAAGLMVNFFVGAAQQGAAEDSPVSERPTEFTPEERAQAMAEVRALAEREKLPAPTAVAFLARNGVNAQVAGVWRWDWTLNLTRGFLELPKEEREAILLHELAHVRHWDTLIITALLWVASAVPVLALLSGAVLESIEPFAGAFLLYFFLSIAFSVFGYFYWSRVQEYAADRYAAFRQGGARALASFFIKLSDDEPKAVNAAKGDLYAGKTAPEARLLRGWDLLKQSYKLHPLTEFRIAALAKAARRSKPAK